MQKAGFLMTRLISFSFTFQLDSQASGYVDWNEFCTYLLLLYRENDYMRTKREIPFLEEPKIRHIVQNRVGTDTILREINLAISYKAGCFTDFLTEWDII